jgi:hypothetical protein
MGSLARAGIAVGTVKDARCHNRPKAAAHAFLS